MADLFSSLGSIAGGLFGNGGDSYKDAMKQYKKYADKSSGYQDPFYQSGKNSIPQYEQWLSGMSDPSQFINNLMGGYSESPYAQYQQQQGMRAAQNIGSATGLSGSTPLMLQSQQNAQDISSKDMDQWLQNVLGINNQYGQGLNTNINRGQGAANNLSNIYNNLGNQMGGAAYGAGMANQSQLSNILSGLLGIGSNIPFGGGSSGGSSGGNSGGGINMSQLLPFLALL
jgi:hypothetical protein